LFGEDYWEIIENCARGNDVYWLYEEMASKTEALSPALDHVPTIKVDNYQNQVAENDLIRTICDAYTVRIFSI
jgi:hypothetical protein